MRGTLDARNFAAAAVSTLPKECIEAVAKSIPPIIAALLTTASPLALKALGNHVRWRVIA
jgi:hypothetical protein